jgi:hypothetical protein
MARSKTRTATINDIEYKSAKEASRQLGISYHTLRSRLLSKSADYEKWIMGPVVPKMTEQQIRKRNKAYSRIKNKEYKENGRFNEYYKQKRETDVQFKLKGTHKQTIFNALKGIGAKDNEFRELTGLSVEKFKEYILSMEPQFFKFWGRDQGDLQLDHIKPIATFDLKMVTEVKECFHYTNYQILTGAQNRLKGANYKKVSK